MCQAEEIEQTKPIDRKSMMCPQWSLESVVYGVCRYKCWKLG